MESGGGVKRKISADDVISKLKDDGDFDRLRVKIVRKLKENEELRNSIVSMVKQSVAINRPGAENMKARQLSDAIHQEIGGKMMDQISVGLWEIIKSGDGMKSEITESVKSVYNKLSNPKGNENGEPSHIDTMPVQKGPNSEVDDLSDSEPKEPPGFSKNNLYQNDISTEQPEEVGPPLPHHVLPTEEQKKELHQSQDVLGPDALDPSLPPGFSAGMAHKQPCDRSDEDPDVPPGFG